MLFVPPFLAVVLARSEAVQSSSSNLFTAGLFEMKLLD